MAPSTGQSDNPGQDGRGGSAFESSERSASPGSISQRAGVRRFMGSRRLRWAVPLGAVAVTGGILAASLVSAAQATPGLPARTPAQLLAAVAGRTGPLPAFTGTVVETANLGFPELPGGSDPTSPDSLMTGSHTIRIWYADPQHIRLAIPGQLSETDVVRKGQDLWVWSSRKNAVTHTRLPAGSGDKVEPPMTKPPLTPQQAANQVLAAVGPTTTVRVASNVTVAGEPSYELVLAPKDSRSLIGQVRIAIDAHRNVPLRVQVFARGSASPAFQTGFTSIAFTRPAAANFNFTPPPGAKVEEQQGVAGVVGLAGPAAGAVIRVRAGKPVQIHGSVPMPVKRLHVPAGTRQTIVVRGGNQIMVSGPGATAIRACRPVAIKDGKPVAIKGAPPTPIPVRGRPPVVIRNGKVVAIGNGPPVQIQCGMPVPFRVAGAPSVIGKGWLAVAVLPAGGSLFGGPVLGGAGDLAGRELHALLGAASRVHGTWGSGQLIRTKILSALVTDDGRMFVGAVTPDVLYSAAAKVHAGQAGR
jgi:outer membrane lipoprotein-sorting protein